MAQMSCGFATIGRAGSWPPRARGTVVSVWDAGGPAAAKPGPWWVGCARWGELVLRGAPAPVVAGPQSWGRKAWPCPRRTLRLPPPHAKQVRPIEQLGGRLPSVQWSGWRGWLGGWGGTSGFWVGSPAASRPGPWWLGVLDGANLFCAGPLRQSWQDRKSRGRRAWPCSEARLRLPSPTQNRSTPSSSWHQRLLGAVVGLAGLARWAEVAPAASGSARLRHFDPVRGVWVCSMGRTCFARGPCASRGRTAKLGPKSMALSAQNATTAATPRKTSPPHRAVGWAASECPVVALGGLARWVGFQVGWGGLLPMATRPRAGRRPAPTGGAHFATRPWRRRLRAPWFSRWG
ncbi:hypothetical protein JOD54_005217 [Actinokineospora baliensis]|nr:hypothetical protein [Actinokineospora baliensis]